MNKWKIGDEVKYAGRKQKFDEGFIVEIIKPGSFPRGLNSILSTARNYISYLVENKETGGVYWLWASDLFPV